MNNEIISKETELFINAVAQLRSLYADALDNVSPGLESEDEALDTMFTEAYNRIAAAAAELARRDILARCRMR